MIYGSISSISKENSFHHKVAAMNVNQGITVHQFYCLNEITDDILYDCTYLKLNSKFNDIEDKSSRNFSSK